MKTIKELELEILDLKAAIQFLAKPRFAELSAEELLYELHWPHYYNNSETIQHVMKQLLKEIQYLLKQLLDK